MITPENNGEPSTEQEFPRSFIQANASHHCNITQTCIIQNGRMLAQQTNVCRRFFTLDFQISHPEKRSPTNTNASEAFQQQTNKHQVKRGKIINYSGARKNHD